MGIPLCHYDGKQKKRGLSVYAVYFPSFLNGSSFIDFIESFIDFYRVFVTLLDYSRRLYQLLWTTLSLYTSSRSNMVCFIQVITEWKWRLLSWPSRLSQLRPGQLFHSLVALLCSCCVLPSPRSPIPSAFRECALALLFSGCLLPAQALFLFTCHGLIPSQCQDHLYVTLACSISIAGAYLYICIYIVPFTWL